MSILLNDENIYVEMKQTSKLDCFGFSLDKTVYDYMRKCVAPRERRGGTSPLCPTPTVTN